MKGLELARGFWEDLLHPALEREAPELTDRIAAGLCGAGSDCLGYDDEHPLRRTARVATLSAGYVDAEAKELRFLFPELLEREGRCRFTGCLHLKEPDCAVKEDVSRGIIAESRYESYRKLMTELSERRKYK